MTDFTANRSKGVVDITLRFNNDQRVVKVSLKPVPLTGRLECAQMRVQKGGKLTSEERFTFTTQAVREFMAIISDWLKPRPRHVAVGSLAERVKISFAYTLSIWEPTAREKICPLAYEDMRVIHMLAAQITDRMTDSKIRAREQHRKLSSGYLDDIKAGVLAEWREDTPCSQELRDFYSSVLGRAFGYKGRVPYKQYTEAMKYLPGIKLAFDQQ